MKDDYKELIEYLDKKFLNIEDRFEKVDRQFDEAREDFSNLQTAVDAYAKRADAYFQEMTMALCKSRSSRALDSTTC